VSPNCARRRTTWREEQDEAGVNKPVGLGVVFHNWPDIGTATWTLAVQLDRSCWKVIHIMKTQKIVKVGLLAAFLTTGFSALCQTPYDYYVPLSVSITGTYETDTISGAITKSATTPQRINDTTLIQLASIALGEDLSIYNTLAYDNDTGEVVALQRSSHAFAELGDLFTVTLPETWVQSGTTNSLTGTFSYFRQGIVTISFDDGNGNAFQLSGLIRETLNSTTTQSVIILSLTCVGQGTLAVSGIPTYAVFSGTVVGSGSIRF
jgi:hypothetical protein